ncbi:MAG: hypothetical protein HZA48_12010 [Planctomycetes bacterium]|nr:hypothetical protein [Planctomycetota bacterium]
MTETNAPQESGTVVLNGLLEGHLPPDENKVLLIRQWVEFAKKNHLCFSLEMELNSFNILADNTPIPADLFNGQTQERIVSVLNELIKIFTPELRKKIFSILRSVEYRNDVKIETAYFLNASGNIDFKSRETELLHGEKAQPTAGQAPKTGSRQAMWMVLSVILIAFAASTFVFDYKKTWHNFISSFKAVIPDEIGIDTADCADYIDVRKGIMLNSGSLLELKISRGKNFPLTFEKYSEEKARIAEKKSISGHMMLESIADGHVCFEYYDNEKKLFFTAEIRIKTLFEKQEITISIPINRAEIPKSIKVTY